MTDYLISRAAALAERHKVADEAKSYGIPQMSLGAHTCRDAIRALPAYEVAVRELVWEHHPMGWIASTPTGQAYIIDVRVKGRVMFIKGMNPPPQFDDLEAAKAAAQADYAARIRSALTATPAADVAGLVEAAKQMLIEYDEVDLDHAEPPSMTAAVSELRAALARMKETKA